MNTKKIEITFYILASIASAIVGVLFVAVFTLDHFQNWPRAIWEGRVVFYTQIVLTPFFVNGGRWFIRLATGAVFIAYCMAGWGLVSSSAFLIFLSGMLIWAAVGGYCFANLARRVVPQKVIKWIEDPWRN